MANQDPNDWKKGLSLEKGGEEVTSGTAQPEKDGSDVLELAKAELERKGGSFERYLDEVIDVAQTSQMEHRVATAAGLLFMYYTNWHDQYSQNGKFDLDRAEYYLAKGRNQDPQCMMMEVEARNELAYTYHKTLGMEKVEEQLEKADRKLKMAVNANYAPAIRWCIAHEGELASGRFPGDMDHSELLYKAFSLWSRHAENSVAAFREEAADKAKYYAGKNSAGASKGKGLGNKKKTGKNSGNCAGVDRYKASNMVRLILCFVFTPIMLVISYHMAVDDGVINGVFLATTLGLINWLILKVAKAILKDNRYDPGPIYLIVHGLLALFAVSFLMMAVCSWFDSFTNGDPYMFLSIWITLALLGAGIPTLLLRGEAAEHSIFYWQMALVLNGVLAVVIYILTEKASIIPRDFIRVIELMVEYLMYALNF